MQPLPLVAEALYAAYTAVREAGDSAKRVTSTAADISTRGDELAGAAGLRVLAENSDVGVAYTEERGTVPLDPDGQYSAVFDDIDGTRNYFEGRDMLPYGPMLGVFDGRNPRFRDCLAAGFLNIPTKTAFLAERGKGAYILEDFEPARLDQAVGVASSGTKQLDGRNTIILDNYMLGDLAREFARFTSLGSAADFRCSAAHIAMVASGAADVFVTADNSRVKTKRKTGEELGPGYLLLNEAGGALVDWSGRDVGNERVGLGEKRAWHTIAAATPELARDFAGVISVIPAVRGYKAAKRL